MLINVSILEVLLHGKPIGTLRRLPVGKHKFAFNESYITDDNRPTLGLRFRDQAGGLVTDVRPTQLQVMPFFSNLLPEGPLRSYLAKGAGVSPKQEFHLLQALGADLPGALTIRSIHDDSWKGDRTLPGAATPSDSNERLCFSLAGVQIKFPVGRRDASGSLAIPASGIGGSHIAKLPSLGYPALPENEFSMMTLARGVGINVPSFALIDVASIVNLPEAFAKPKGKAFLIERFDRRPDGSPIHIEDFAQVFDVYPEHKYQRAKMRTIAQVLATESTGADIAELVRRMTFNALIGNGDMHLKNWSLIYPDQRHAALAPAYDFVSTIPYIPNDAGALNVSRGQSKAFDTFSASELAHLAVKANLPEKLVSDTARETVDCFKQLWEAEKDHLPMATDVVRAIDRHWSTVPIARM